MHEGSSSDQPGDEELEDGLSAAHVTGDYANALEAHYKTFFGNPSRIVVHEIKSVGVHVDTYIFPPNEDRPFTTAATVGMGARPIETSEICESCKAALDASGAIAERHSELLMYLHPNWDFDDPAGLYPILMMTYVARSPHVDRHAFGWGMSYRFPEQVVPEGSLLTNGYVMKPVWENIDGDIDDFARVQLPDGEICNLYWLVPITTAECYVKRTQGPKALREILADSDDFLFDLDRQCFVEYENRAQRRARAKAQRTRAKRRPLTSVYELKCMDCGQTSDG
jgi:hypothetical protein